MGIVPVSSPSVAPSDTAQSASLQEEAPKTTHTAPATEGELDIKIFNSIFKSFKLLKLVLRSLSKVSLIQKNHPYLEESKHHDY